MLDRNSRKNGVDKCPRTDNGQSVQIVTAFLQLHQMLQIIDYS